MIPITDKMRDVLMLVAAVCWGFVIYASWVGGAAKDNQLIYFGLLACAVLTVVYYLMGAVVNEKMSTTVLIWPVLLNGIFQAIAFEGRDFRSSARHHKGIRRKERDLV